MAKWDRKADHRRLDAMTSSRAHRRELVQRHARKDACPGCGGDLPLHHPGALSRGPLQVELCSACGRKEANASWGIQHDPDLYARMGTLNGGPLNGTAVVAAPWQTTFTASSAQPVFPLVQGNSMPYPVVANTTINYQANYWMPQPASIQATYVPIVYQWQPTPTTADPSTYCIVGQMAVCLTPEEADQRLRDTRARLQRDAMVKARARKRARRLLLECLDESQMHAFARRGEIPVRAIDGRQYVIRKGRTVHELDARGQAIRSHCIHLPYNWVEEDTMIVLKMMLETDTEEFLRIANSSGLRQPVEEYALAA